jgi:pilus assembly protein CpaF
MDAATAMPRAAHDATDALAVDLWITRRDGAPVGQRQFVGVQHVTVGRDPSCSVPLDDLSISRRHAVLRLERDSVWVEDVSTNGTQVGERHVRHGTLQASYGTKIRLGDMVLCPCRTGTDPKPVPVPPSAALAPSPAPASQSQEQPRIALPATPPDGITIKAAADAALPDLRREVHRRLLEQLDMSAIEPGRAEDPTLRPRVLAALRRIVSTLSDRLPLGLTPDALVGQMADEALGLGPLEALLADRTVSEIMVLDAHNIYVERGGRVQRSECQFTDDERVRAVIERIVTPLGRRIDESSPLVDARLPDGSRVNVVIRPIALRGSCITIRKFASKPFDLSALIAHGALSEAMGRFLIRSVRAKKNIVISGGTGSGKTTLLNVLSAAIPEDERIVTIEDAAELKLSQPHVVSLESRPPNMEGKGEVSIRDLLKNALRMRPDRIVVGECRGGEALDMLQAMNTGHDGSLTTTHANSPAEGLARLETLALMAGVGLPQAAIRQQISKSVQLLVQQSRLSDGSRKITAIVEMAGLSDSGHFQLRPIFEYVRTGTTPDGKVQGAHQSTGYLPSYLSEMMIKGLIPKGEAFL